MAGASHSPLFIPHCYVHAGPIRDGRLPTPEVLLKDIQRPQVAQPRDTVCQPSRDPGPLQELCIGLQSSQMSPEAMHRLGMEGWLPERPRERERAGTHLRHALFDGVDPDTRNVDGADGSPQRHRTCTARSLHGSLPDSRLPSHESIPPLTGQESFDTLDADAEASKDQTGHSPRGQTCPSARRQTRSQRVQPKEGERALPTRRAGIR